MAPIKEALIFTGTPHLMQHWRSELSGQQEHSMWSIQDISAYIREEGPCLIVGQSLDCISWFLLSLNIIKSKSLSKLIRSKTSPYSVIYSVWNEQRSHLKIWEDWSRQSIKKEIGPCHHQELHCQLWSDVDLQQNSVWLHLFSHEINQFCSSHTVQEVLIDKFNILDESLR